MSDHIESGPSTIHGTGVFAIATLLANSLIGRFTGSPSAVDGPHVLWVEDDEGVWRGVDGGDVLRFLNHSREPNVEFSGTDLYALTDIDTGTELLLHYGDEWDDVP